MTQAQCLDTGDPSDLQDDEALSPQGMKRVGDFSRTQRALEPKCSLLGVCQPSKTRWRNAP